MHPEFSITDEQIKKAERILLPIGGEFDDERKDFIRELNTLDLKAVPGSGKTTVLLAKLIILEDLLPLKGNSGILVISHTNAAIEEIKERIGAHCPKLFRYPNFIGTIQSFVDTFLCIPAYQNKYKKRINRIDDDAYKNSHILTSHIHSFLRSKPGKGEEIIFKSTLLLNNKLGFPLKDDSSFPLKNPEKPTYSDLVNIKKSIREKGILCFDEAYYLGLEYIKEYSIVKVLLQRRFSFVFVDEMQDMAKYQYDILEKIFFDEGKAECKYQRIGDKNQSIFDDKNSLEEIWIDRKHILKLTGSHRLTSRIAELVNYFSVDVSEGFEIIGLRIGDIKPCIIVYNDDNIEEVIPCFSALVRRLIDENKIELTEKSIFKAISWVKKSSKEKDIALSDYFPEFNLEQQSKKVFYENLGGYLNSINIEVDTFRDIKNTFLQFLLKILYTEGVRDIDDMPYTKRSLFRFLKNNYPSEYEILKTNLYVWILKVIKGLREEAVNSIQGFIPTFLNIFGSKGVLSASILVDNISSHTVTTPIESETLTNKVNHHGFDINISTVHSVKGQTHTATLYMESFLKRGYESKRLAKQFLCNLLKGTENNITKQSAKMCYVGMSRPTDFLCVAIHQSRFGTELGKIDTDKWEVMIL